MDDKPKSGRLWPRVRSALSPRGSGSDSNEGTTTESTEPVSERRREQIRRAQRLHRQRKAEHTQRLLAEIEDLRSQDVTKTARIDHLEGTVTYLSTLLTQHGIPHQISKSGQQEAQAQIKVFGPTSTSNSQSVQANPQIVQVIMPPSLHRMTSNPAPVSSFAGADLLGSSPAPAASLSDPQTGIEFILTLEQPCFYHHHNHPSWDDDHLLGHSVMMQAPIMARAPPLISSGRSGGGDGDDPQPRLPPAASWSVPSEELERLLYFSNQIRLANEVTPVQVWSRIREHGMTGWSPTKVTLDALLNALRAAVYCYGFGAVIEKDVFEGIFRQYVQAP